MARSGKSFVKCLCNTKYNEENKSHFQLETHDAYKRSLHSEGDKILMIHVDKKPFVHTIAMLSDSINVNLPPKCV